MAQAMTEKDGPVAGLDAPNILVVDDSRTNLHVLCARLAAMGYRPTPAESGTLALDHLQARRFDMVLLDMVMPGMSGIQALTEIRRMSRHADLPVLMITARSDPAAVIEALRAGADDHVAKPFEFDVLQARIERLLARSRAVADLRRANASLDARITSRAVEMGELRQQLAEITAERMRLASSLRFLQAEVDRLSAGTTASV